MSHPLAKLTCSIFKLDPLGVTPTEPVADVQPGFSPRRVTLDMIDQEGASYDYDVTEHNVAGFRDIASNVRKRLETITVQGTLGRTAPFVVPIALGQSPFARRDTERLEALKAIADARAPVMVVTPRVGLAKALITYIQHQWSPQNGESLLVSITAREVRIVSPLIGTAVAADFPAQNPGNNVATGGGQSATATVNQSATPSGIVGVPPTLGALP
jgi:hypothetical protein